MGKVGLSVAIGCAIGVAPTASAATTRNFGFILTKLNLAFYHGDEKIECPEGRSPVVRDAYLATQSKTEQARLIKPENAREFEEKYKQGYVFSPTGKDICTNSELFDTPDRPLQRIGQGKVAIGLDLDGSIDDEHPAQGTCKHQSYSDTSGAKGIDNQFFRAIACNTFWRGLSNGAGDALPQLQTQQNPALLVVRGVSNWKNDPSVVVEIGSSSDKPVGGKIVTDGSYALTNEQRYRTTIKGKIKDGVLYTDAANITLKTDWVGASGGELILRHARFRLTLTPTKGLEGTAGAYRPIDNAVGLLHVGGPGVASAAGVECASVRKTMRVLADGDRNPKSGMCNSISQGLEIAAVPAFVFDRGVMLGGNSQGAPDRIVVRPDRR